MKKKSHKPKHCVCGRPITWPHGGYMKRCECGHAMHRDGRDLGTARCYVLRHEWIQALARIGFACESDAEIATALETLAQDHSLSEIGRMVGFRYQTIASHVSTAHRRPRGGSEKGRGAKIRVIWQGRRQTLRELAEAHGLSYQNVYERLRRGWTLETSLTTPLMKSGQTLHPRSRDWSR